MAPASDHTRTVNRYYLLASVCITVAAIFTLPLGNSTWQALADAGFLAALVLGAIGLKHKTTRTPAGLATKVTQASSAVYLILAILMMWVLAAEHHVLPRLPSLSDLDFANYLVGWPVIEVVIGGAILNSFFKLKASWLGYVSAALMIACSVIWWMAAPRPVSTPSPQTQMGKSVPLTQPEFAGLDQAVAIEAGAEGIPAGTKTTLRDVHYDGSRATGNVTFSNGAVPKNFTAAKTSGNWVVTED